MTSDPESQDPRRIEAASLPPSSDSALVRFLYPPPAKRSIGAIWKWWERRRLAYTLIAGTGAGISVLAHSLLDVLQGGRIEVDGVPIVAFVLWINLAYTLGPITESALHKIWGRELRPVGPHLLRAGLILSVGLVFLLPMLLFGMRIGAAVLGAIFGLAPIFG